jgi:hypothetical protein
VFKLRRQHYADLPFEAYDQTETKCAGRAAAQTRFQMKAQMKLKWNPNGNFE